MHYLQPLLHALSDTACTPQQWSSGTLALLVKPGKSGNHPSDLRPIVLLEPTGKAVLGLVASQIQPELTPRDLLASASRWKEFIFKDILTSHGW